jgi:hypothetical protein
MKSSDFLTALTAEAKAQAQIKEYHLLPASLSRFGSFFWRHTWVFLVVVAVLLAFFILHLSGIQP